MCLPAKSGDLLTIPRMPFDISIYFLSEFMLNQVYADLRNASFKIGTTFSYNLHSYYLRT